MTKNYYVIALYDWPSKSAGKLSSKVTPYSIVTHSWDLSTWDIVTFGWEISCNISTTTSSEKQGQKDFLVREMNFLFEAFWGKEGKEIFSKLVQNDRDMCFVSRCWRCKTIPDFNLFRYSFTMKQMNPCAFLSLRKLTKCLADFRSYFVVNLLNI